MTDHVTSQQVMFQSWNRLENMQELDTFVHTLMTLQADFDQKRQRFQEDIEKFQVQLSNTTAAALHKHTQEFHKFQDTMVNEIINCKAACFQHNNDLYAQIVVRLYESHHQNFRRLKRVASQAERHWYGGGGGNIPGQWDMMDSRDARVDHVIAQYQDLKEQLEEHFVRIENICNQNDRSIDTFFSQLPTLHSRRTMPELNYGNIAWKTRKRAYKFFKKLDCIHNPKSLKRRLGLGWFLWR
jgi:hypothetical protein